jgi:predicted transcriptional regulator
MNVEIITKLLEGKVVTSCGNACRKLDRAFTSDLMSDVLTLKQCEDVLLLTGLANIQTIRTAEMAGLYLVVLIRGKRASEDMIQLAEENEISIIESAFSAFRASAVLYNAGIKSLF